MVHMIPLTVVPLIVYNLVGYGLAGADPWASQVFNIPTLSGVRWSMNVGELLVSFAIVLLFFELRKAVLPGRSVIANRVLSMIVFVAYAVEFIAAGAAAHSVFFILTLIALFDVAVRFSVAARLTTHDMALGNDVDRAV